MPKYHFNAVKLADLLAPGYVRNANGTLTASSQQAAKKAVERSLRSRGYDPTTGTITITRM
ncbi:hypothetical protein ACFW5U_36075 [Streptomyces rochei]|uniref:hypothetical protein n=1 Tax=Streptomyces rochei TaxID=1928 RepID=UPI0036BF3D78